MPLTYRRPWPAIVDLSLHCTTTLRSLGGSMGQAMPLILSRLLTMAITLVLPLGLARLLDPAGFATYKQFFLVSQTVLQLGQLGLLQSLKYFLPAGGEERGAYVVQATLSLLIVALPVALGLWCATPWLGRYIGDGQLAALGAPLTITATAMLLSGPLEATLLGEGRIGLTAVVTLLGDLLRAALLLGGALAGGVWGLAWAGATHALMRTIVLATALTLALVPRRRPRATLWRQQLDYALPLAGTAVAQGAQKQLAQYAVSIACTAQAYAEYAVGSFHLGMFDVLYSPISEVLQLRLGQSRTTDASGRALCPGGVAQWRSACVQLALVMWPATVLAWLLGPTLLVLLYTRKYEASVPLFLLATCEIPLLAFPIDSVLRAMGATRFLFRWQVARTALTAALVLSGLRRFGPAGAIAGHVLSETISRAVLLARGRRLLQSPRPLCCEPTLAWIALAAIAAAPPAWLVSRHTVGWQCLLALPIYGAGYALGLLGVLSASRSSASNNP